MELRNRFLVLKQAQEENESPEEEVRENMVEDQKSYT